MDKASRYSLDKAKCFINRNQYQTMSTKLKVFFPYSSPNKPLLLRFVNAFCRYFQCEPLHDQTDDAEGLPPDVCLKWANECDIAVILLTPDVVTNEDKFVRKFELPRLRERYSEEHTALTLHSVMLEDCTASKLPEHYQTWLFQAYWVDFPKSISAANQKKHEYISFENLHDDEINMFMKKLAGSVEKSYKSMLERKTRKNNCINQVTEKEEVTNSKQDLNNDLLISQMIEKMLPLTRSMEDALRKASNDGIWLKLALEKPTISLKPYSYIFCQKIIPLCLQCKENYKSTLTKKEAIESLNNIMTVLSTCFDDPKNNLNSEIEGLYDFLEITHSQSSLGGLGILTAVDGKLIESLTSIVSKLEVIKQDAFHFNGSSTN